MNGKTTSDTIADFEVLANELKCFYSVLLHYDVDLLSSPYKILWSALPDYVLMETMHKRIS